jgi:hypothetical protein
VGAAYSIWSEMVPYETIVERSLLADLCRRQIRLVVAVTPPTVARAPALVGACRDAAVEIALWPMLDEHDGRWASAANAATFCAFTESLVESLRASGTLPDEIALDLEPPIARVREMLRGSPRAVLQLPTERGELARLVAALHDCGLRVSAVVTLLAALPSAVASRGWQGLLGTRVDGIPFDSVNAMAYTTLIQGYTRGTLRRKDARSVLAAVADTTARRWCDRAAISVGAVGAGALGDERIYRTPTELAEDAAIARGAGVRNLALFALDGALARPPLAQWLDALCAPAEIASPALTVRARAVLAGASALGAAAALLVRR